MRSPFVLIALLVVTVAPRGTFAAKRPRVLFIAVDDLNDWIGCLGGHPQALTPNIDRLAARGVLFTNAHCAAPACNPSRAAVFSGRMPQVSGVWSNRREESLRKSFPQAVLLTTVFEEAGYRTLGTGKLIHSSSQSVVQEYFGTEQRWSPFSKAAVQYTAEELPSKGSDNPRHVLQDSLSRKVVLPLNRMPSDRNPQKKDGESFDWGPFDVPDSDFGDTRITDWAIEKLASLHDEPLFLGVGYYRPHIPLWAPKRFFDRFEDEPAELPLIRGNDLTDLSDIARKWALEPVTAGSHATVVAHNQWRPAVEAYLACVTYVDYEIGRLLDALDQSPTAENTVVVLWTDHGWHLGEKQHWGKWTGWECATRVPLIIVPPQAELGHFAPPGSQCHQPVSLIDMYPTLLDLCGLEPQRELDGQSLVPLLKNPNHQSGRAVLTMFDRDNASLRTERWRYIRYAEGPEELYDLKNDLHEWTNLIGDESSAEVRRTMSAALNSRLTEIAAGAASP